MPIKATWTKRANFKIQNLSLNRHISWFHQNRMIFHWNTVKTQDSGGRHLENRSFGHNSSTDWSISAKFCIRKRNGMPAKATWQKLQIFKMQDGGRPPLWTSLSNHISAKKCRILMTFRVLQHILNLMTVTWPKIIFFKIQDGGWLPSSKSFFDITQQAIVRFQQIFAIWSKIACR